VLQGLADTRLSHPTDSHPPLGVRLESLGISMGEVEPDVLNVHPEPAAIGLVEQPERFEEEVSQVFQDILAKQMTLGLSPSLDDDAQGETTGIIEINKQTIAALLEIDPNTLASAFIAMEYWMLILTRIFLVLATDGMLYGCKVRRFFKPPTSEKEVRRWFDLRFYLTSRNITKCRGTGPTFDASLAEDVADFTISRDQIESVEFDPTAKWGMGAVPHTGKLYVKMRDGNRREFIILGAQNGHEIEEQLVSWLSEAREG